MWITDLMIVAGVVVVVTVAVAGIVWVDNRLHRHRSEHEGDGVAADVGSVPPRTDRLNTLPADAERSR